MIRVERIVNTVLHSNTFILFRDDRDLVYLVDPGNTMLIGQWLEQHGKRVGGILLTHAHFDHINAVNDILIKDSGIPVYLSVHEGKDIIGDTKRNFSKYHETPYAVHLEKFVELEDGDIILLWGETPMAVYATPGHSVDSLTMVCDRFIFTGDALIPGIKVVVKLREGGNKADALRSVQRIFRIVEDTPDGILCPGHEEMIPVCELNKAFRYVTI